MNRIISSLCFLLLLGGVYGQETYTTSIELAWHEKEISNIHKDLELTIQSFENAALDAHKPQVPRYLHHIPVTGPGVIDVKIIPLETSTVDLDHAESISSLSSDYSFNYEIVQNRNQYQANISITPIRKTNSGFERLLNFNLSVQHKKDNNSVVSRDPGQTYTSELASGTVFKVAIPQEGIYKIDGNYLSDQLEINISSISPDNLQVFGNMGGRLPRATSADQPDDLVEIPILMQDGGDGAFSNSDYFLFYAEGADKWSYTTEYSYDKNVYDVNNFIFIKIDGQNGKRITPSAGPSAVEYESSDFDFVQIFEDDRTNLLGAYNNTEGTGKDWYGDYFGVETSKEYANQFDISDLTTLGEGNIKMRFAARGENKTNTKLKINGVTFEKDASGTSLSDIEADYAKEVVIQEDINLNSSNNTIGIEYVKSTPNDEGWLDYIQLEYRKKITNKYDQIRVSDKRSLDYATAALNIPEGSFSFWNISDINNPSIINPSDNKISYEVDDQLNTFYFVKGENYLSPGEGESIENQNIHSIERADLIVVYHPDFEEAANSLANHRRDYSGYQVSTVNILELYNEFSSGRKDPTALRDFARMLLIRDQEFKYMTLIGDGSYDYRNLTPNLLDHNFIPVFETEESLDPINGFPSDDYYALLSDDEGTDLKGALDIAVGRLPVTTAEMANGVVEKIINYDTNTEALGDWRLKIAFAADDEDSSLHLDQADRIAERIEDDDPIYNQTKIYYDAYVQESTPGGDRYPAATEALNTAVQNGTLILNYMGHGGPKGWAQERVLKVSDIETWNNDKELPILITATCSFTGYDDPAIISAGEAAIQKEKGGVLALLTTVRAVYSSENERLAKAVFGVIFEKVDGKAQTLGDIMRTAKNQNADSNNVLNDRKFSLIGDASQKIAIPEYNINTTSINGEIPSEADTLNALQTVTITGNITDESGSIVSDFNGQIFPTVYDKESTLTTLSNDTRSPERDFDVYRNILFKGSASVTNGQFTFTFVMPQDINYVFGQGRISYYAHDGVSRDAAGNYNDVVIGGSNPNIIVDEQGPELELYMNDENFVFGGTTDNKPTLLALLSDDLGINVSGTSIGHDITAILDDDIQNTYILNEFYEANVDDHTSGKVRFPFTELETGRHSLTLKAWDVSNNSTEGRIEFVVINQSDESLRNVYNYPNPFTSSTTFLFEHDLVGSDLDVYVDIYTVAGKLVKSINQSVFATGYRVNDVNWNAKDDFGSSLGKGLYLYKIKVVSKELNQFRESDFEKLVIL